MCACFVVKYFYLEFSPQYLRLDMLIYLLDITTSFLTTWGTSVPNIGNETCQFLCD